MDYETVISHRWMALDETRNRAYLEALREVVGPETTVLDLGAGLGTLGLLAARLGARRVFLVEPTEMAHLARRIAAENSLGSRVEVLHGRIESVELPERIDVITSVMTGNFLLAEDLLPITFHARDRWLRPGGALLPEAAVMEVAPVSAPAFFERQISCWSREHLGLSLAAARSYAANHVFAPPAKDVAGGLLAPPAELASYDLRTSTSIRLDGTAEVEISQSGTCHGWLGWFRMKLGARWLSTAPDAERTHWSPAFFPLDPPLPVAEGDVLNVHFSRPPRGDWTWTTRSATGASRGSTFFSRPTTVGALRSLGDSARPRRSRRGEATTFVLQEMDGASTVAELALRVRERFPDLLPGEAEARTFVQSLVRRYS